MKHLLRHLSLISFLLIFSSFADAKPPQKKVRVTISAPSVILAQTAVEAEGVIRLMNHISCDANEASFCMQLCKGPSCEWTESYCRDCFGSSSVVMHDIFVRLLPTYSPVRTTDVRLEVENLLSRMITGSMLLVPSQSPYDFFNASGDPGMSPHLKNLCGSDKGFVAVQLDEDSRPLKALFAVCATAQGLVATVLRRSDEPPLEQIPDSLALKLTTEITLRKP